MNDTLAAVLKNDPEWNALPVDTPVPIRTLVRACLEKDRRDIWILDLKRQTLTRLTSDPVLDRIPVWTRDGRRIIFSSDRDGSNSLFWQPKVCLRCGRI